METTYKFGRYALIPSFPYRSAFCLASLRMSSATWRSKSSSVTVLADEPIDARTRFDTTEERDEWDMKVKGQP